MIKFHRHGECGGMCKYCEPSFGFAHTMEDIGYDKNHPHWVYIGITRIPSLCKEIKKYWHNITDDMNKLEMQ